ncbi:hypothetical protein PV325_009980 [Microctonus aethiopoides]|nr:hypothetical protein PV325_009980 [Microctonus aethiopoides]KAK0074988.1 hypothetical protein PV326_011976 [Microctonus aethiopoides]
MFNINSVISKVPGPRTSGSLYPEHRIQGDGSHVRRKRYPEWKSWYGFRPQIPVSDSISPHFMKLSHKHFISNSTSPQQHLLTDFSLNFPSFILIVFLIVDDKMRLNAEHRKMSNFHFYEDKIENNSKCQKIGFYLN